jgi:hypothetical protein
MRIFTSLNINYYIKDLYNIRVNGINVYIKYYLEKYLRILSIKISNNKVEFVEKFILKNTILK